MNVSQFLGRPSLYEKIIEYEQWCRVVEIVRSHIKMYINSHKNFKTVLKVIIWYMVFSKLDMKIITYYEE